MRDRIYIVVATEMDSPGTEILAVFSSRAYADWIVSVIGKAAYRNIDIHEATSNDEIAEDA